MLTLAADSSTQPVNRVLPLTLTPHRDRCRDPLYHSCHAPPVSRRRARYRRMKTAVVGSWWLSGDIVDKRSKLGEQLVFQKSHKLVGVKHIGLNTGSVRFDRLDAAQLIKTSPACQKHIGKGKCKSAAAREFESALHEPPELLCGGAVLKDAAVVVVAAVEEPRLRVVSGSEGKP